MWNFALSFDLQANSMQQDSHIKRTVQNYDSVVRKTIGLFNLHDNKPKWANEWRNERARESQTDRVSAYTSIHLHRPLRSVSSLCYKCNVYFLTICSLACHFHSFLIRLVILWRAHVNKSQLRINNHCDTDLFNASHKASNIYLNTQFCISICSVSHSIRILSQSFT